MFAEADVTCGSPLRRTGMDVELGVTLALSSSGAECCRYLMLKRTSRSSLAGASLLLLLAGTPAAQKLSDDDVNQLIAEFTAAESESHAALNRYGYKCDVVVRRS